MKSQQTFSRGAVSLFMVIIAMLVITVITVGFLRLMAADQRQASDSDLSQSAYDSAMAGVEDAKRALLAYQRDCSTSTTGACTTRKAQLASSQCNTALQGIVAVSEGSGEVPIQRSAGSAADRRLDQAYTCVTIEPTTAEYVGSLAAGESKVIPLKGAGEFRKVRLSWFTRDDIADNGGAVNRPSATAGLGLTRQADWPVNRPPVLRSQLMQVGANFTLGGFDTVTKNGQSNTNTLFLYPTSLSSSVDIDMNGGDSRRIQGEEYPSPSASAPYPVSCKANVSAGGYACSAVMTLPTPVGGGTNRTAFLRLVPFYRATHFQVELLSASNSVVMFDGVQPKVDATGRANDLFRRVEARVDIGVADFPFPEAAVDIVGNFCKDFTVTPSEYIAGACTP